MKRRRTACGVIAAMVAAWVVTGEARVQHTLPSMDETKTWLETEGLDLMRARRVKSDNGTVTEVEETIDSIPLHNCMLSWRMTERIEVTVNGSAIRPSVSTVDAAITLAEIGAGSIAVAPDSTFSDSPVYALRLGIKQSRMAPPRAP